MNPLHKIGMFLRWTGTGIVGIAIVAIPILTLTLAYIKWDNYSMQRELDIRSEVIAAVVKAFADESISTATTDERSKIEFQLAIEKERQILPQPVLAFTLHDSTDEEPVRTASVCSDPICQLARLQAGEHYANN